MQILYFNWIELSRSLDDLNLNNFPIDDKFNPIRNNKFYFIFFNDLFSHLLEHLDKSKIWQPQ